MSSSLKVASSSSAARRQRDTLKWVRTKRWLDSIYDEPVLQAADIFCGCGGISLGYLEAARRAGRGAAIRMAVDLDPDATAVYRHNLGQLCGAVTNADIGVLFDGQLGDTPTDAERRVCEEYGRVSVVMAGPPCQGHSDLNNSTRRNDPRNLLYLRAARSVEILRPAWAVIENVPSVVHSSANVVQRSTEHLESIGYRVCGGVVDMRFLGLPQRRRRHVLLATTSPGVDLKTILPSGKMPRVPLGPFLRGLEDEVADTLVTTPAKLTAENLSRVAHLFDNDLYDLPDAHRPPCHRDKPHTYNSVYGRLRWDEPAQTITSGFGSPGQGRYIHPRRRRLITPHEAARIQGFPDFFDFSIARGLTSLRTMIGNAVPPPLMIEIFDRIFAQGGL